ncbi:hypothetical protein BASA60_008082 [Batrachochytrium salamandrivorans]|nr:hypothetical protein BASA60_008082 [Batrachochytrium salamandrivorans]
MEAHRHEASCINLQQKKGLCERTQDIHPLKSLKGPLPPSKETSGPAFVRLNGAGSTAESRDSMAAPFVISSELERQREQLSRASNISIRVDSLSDLASVKTSNGDTRSSGSRMLDGSRSIGSISQLTKVAIDEESLDNSRAFKEIEIVLKKAQRKIDANLTKAEDNLFKKVNQESMMAEDNDQLAMLHILAPIQLPQISGATKIPPVRSRVESVPSSTADDVFNRLADPSQYPPAYKAKFEAIQRHNDMVSISRSTEKLAYAHTSHTNLSTKKSDLVNHLTGSRFRPSLGRVDHPGYINSIGHVDDVEKNKLHIKGKTRSSSHADIFAKISPNASMARHVGESLDDSLIENTKDIVSTEVTDSMEIVDAKSSLTPGLVEDMPPSIPPPENRPAQYKI